VFGSVDWANVSIVGAFVVGVAGGVVLTIRLLRVALDIVRREREH
jgi:hypothetical protein